MTLDRWLRVRADGFRFRAGPIPKESRAVVLARLTSKLDALRDRMIGDGPVPAVDANEVRRRLHDLLVLRGFR